MKIAWLIGAPTTLLAILIAGAGAAYAFGCAVNATTINFGGYRPLHSGELVSVGTITYNCTGVHGRVTITLDRGTSGSVRERSMRQGVNSIKYGLYLDATGSNVWGDGSEGSQVYVARTSTDGATVRLTVFGRVQPRQNVAAGDYRDTVTVNLNY